MLLSNMTQQENHLVIYKQMLEETDEQIQKFPLGSKLLHVDSQGSHDMCIWFLCNPNQEQTFQKKIRIHGTGHPVDSNLLETFDYLGTCKLMQDTLIFHIFVSKENV